MIDLWTRLRSAPPSARPRAPTSGHASHSGSRRAPTGTARRSPGVARRARPKFGRSVSWFVAEHDDGTLGGFGVATAPGTGMPSDPTDAAVLGLLAVAPAAQGQGLARALLRHVTDQLAELGHTRVVLHALLDNAAALRLYESEGWEAVGEPFEHPLLGRPMRTYGRDLRADTRFS